MSLRTYAYVVVARATQRFAPTGLGVSRAPEDTQADHHQKNRSGSCASSCPYGGCPGRHLGGLSACGRHYWAYICSSNLLLSVSVTAFCHSSGAVQWLILVSSLIRLHGAPGTHSWCATCNRYWQRPALVEPCSNYGCDAIRSPVILNCWMQNGDYSTTPATRCLRGRPLPAIRRTDRLPNQPAFRAPGRLHRGSL